MSAASSDDGNAAANAAEKIAAALLPALASRAEKMGSSQEGGMDMLKFGLGLGMGLGASGMVRGLLENDHKGRRRRRSSVKGISGEETCPEERMSAEQVEAALVARDRAASLGLPIGVAGATAESAELEILDHSDEEAQRAEFRGNATELSTTEKFQGVEIVEQQQQQHPQGEYYSCDDDIEKDDGDNKNRTEALTKPPDERPVARPLIGGDRQEDIERTVPVVAHPECVRGYRTHAAISIKAEKPIFVGSSKADGSLLRRVSEPLPKDFFKNIHETRVAPAKCDYLPWIPNLPTPKPVGRLKPRSAALDWAAVGFDPWSAGREPLTTEFVQSLASKADAIANGPSQSRKGNKIKEPNHSSVAEASFIDVMDSHGLAVEEAEAAQASKRADDFAQLTSWARHSKYREIEDAMNQPDWCLPIDYQDKAGNTMLSIAVQNGNKRIAKLCLRRGANINLPNNNGQTVLHYAYAYGFESLADYLKSKGADDTLHNLDGLTCYEGLSLTELEQI